MKHRIEIKPREGIGIHFLLGELDLANQLTGYTIRHDSGTGAPVVQLDLHGAGYRALLESAEVELDPELAATLVKLGWTPPGSAPEEDGECLNCEGAATACDWCDAGRAARAAQAEEVTA